MTSPTFCSIETLRKLDVVIPIKHNQKEVSLKMVFILIDWLAEVSKCEKSQLSTFFLTVKLVKLFVSLHDDILKKDLQLYGSVCFLLASKQEEIIPTTVDDIVTLCDGQYTSDQVLDAEIEVLETLKYRVKYPTVIDYLKYYGKKPPQTISDEILCCAAISAIECRLSCYSCEDIAIAIISLVENTNVEEPLCTIKLRVRDILVRAQKSSLVGCKQLVDVDISHLIKGEWKSQSTEEHQTELEYVGLEKITYNPSHKTDAIDKGIYGSIGRYEGHAVKVLDKDSKDGITVSFLRELASFSAFAAMVKNGVHTVEFKGCCAVRNEEYLFLEYASLGNLKTFSSFNRQLFTNLDSAKEIAKQLLRGLSFMHSIGLMHRDIKPHNILVFGTINSPSFKYCDFGMTRGPGIVIQDGNCFTDNVITLWYRPLEVLLKGRTRNGMVYNASVDVWSLGCVIFEMINNVPLFAGDNVFDQIQCIVERMGVCRDYLFSNYDPIIEYTIHTYFGQRTNYSNINNIRFPKNPKSWPQNTVIDQVVGMCLQVDAKKRCTAQQALDELCAE